MSKVWRKKLEPSKVSTGHRSHDQGCGVHKDKRQGKGSRSQKIAKRIEEEKK